MLASICLAYDTNPFFNFSLSICPPFFRLFLDHACASLIPKFGCILEQSFYLKPPEEWVMQFALFQSTLAPFKNIGYLSLGFIFLTLAWFCLKHLAHRSKKTFYLLSTLFLIYHTSNMALSWPIISFNMPTVGDPYANIATQAIISLAILTLGSFAFGALMDTSINVLKKSSSNQPKLLSYFLGFLFGSAFYSLIDTFNFINAAPKINLPFEYIFNSISPITSLSLYAIMQGIYPFALIALIGLKNQMPSWLITLLAFCIALGIPSVFTHDLSMYILQASILAVFSSCIVHIILQDWRTLTTSYLAFATLPVIVTGIQFKLVPLTALSASLTLITYFILCMYLEKKNHHH